MECGSLRPIAIGVPASRGLAVGQVVRVEEGSPLRDLRRGVPVVIVAGTASLSLLTLVLGAGRELQVSAIVVERGGSMRSVARVARELGVPAVVGVLDALTSMRDGELVVVDGLTGGVYELGTAGSSSDGMRPSEPRRLGSAA
jgi:pyruvate, water dikinase